MREKKKIKVLGSCKFFNENHIYVFSTMLVLWIMATYIGGALLLQHLYPKGYNEEKGCFLSTAAIIFSKGEQEKMLVTLKEPDSYNASYDFEKNKQNPNIIIKNTDKVLDLKNKGIWITEGQCYMTAASFLGIIIATVFCMIFQIGDAFAFIFPLVRKLAVEAISLLASIIGIPFSLVSLFGLIVIVAGSMFAFPILLICHFIMSIIQIVKTIINKKRTNKESYEAG